MNQPAPYKELKLQGLAGLRPMNLRPALKPHLPDRQGRRSKLLLCIWEAKYFTAPQSQEFQDVASLIAQIIVS
jgi:hypothetical protein